MRCEEDRFERADGKAEFLRWEIQPWHDASGEVGGLCFFTESITERKRMEDQLRVHSQVLLSISEAVCFVNTEGIIQFANPSFEKMFGYAPGQLVGRPVVELNDYTPEESRRLLDEILAAVMHSSGIWSGEFRNRRKDGAVFWTEAKVASSYFEDAPYFVSVQQDVTERKRNEEQAASLRNQLAHAGRVAVIGEMASGLAHELNQPLAAMQLYVGAAQDVVSRLDSPQLHRLLGNIGEQAVRAADIVRGMRSFIKRESERRAPVDLNSLIRAVLPLLHHDLRKYEVILQLNLDECLPPVCVDAIQIQQVLANLIRNAVDAMAVVEDRARVLSIYSEVVPDGVGMGVIDSGSGIRPEMIDKLFQPFQTDKPAGLGLGLAISRTLVEAHGGRIDARPNPQGGAIFYFNLPINTRSSEASF